MSMSSLRPPTSAALETRPPNVTLQFLRENIQAAQRKNLPQTEYARAVVLFLSWEHDPITENMHRADLLRLFGSIDGYALEKYEIPGKLGSTIAYERICVPWLCSRVERPMHLVVRKLVENLTTLDGEPATVVQIYALLMREAYQGLGGTLTVAPIHRRNSDRTFAVKLQPLHTSLEIPEFRLQELLASAPKALIQASVQQPTPGVEVVEWRQFLMDSSSRIHSLEVTVQAVYQTGYKTWIIHLLVSVDVWALLWDHQPALKFVEFVTLGNIRDSLNFMHGPFETIEPSFETEEGLVFIKEEKGLVAIKKEGDSEIDYASDHNIKREASC